MEGLFEFYDQGLGLDMANRHLARMVSHIGHRYPQMKILEVGKVTYTFFTGGANGKNSRRWNWWVYKNNTVLSRGHVFQLYLYRHIERFL